MKNFIKDFKEFAMRGNVIDLAVGVVIGGAFGKIVSSLVADIIMPIVSLITGGTSFASMKYTFKSLTSGVPASINYGMFIQNVIDFLIIALAIFMMIRLLALAKKKAVAEADEEEAEEAEETISSDEAKLLTEIRDLLAEQAKNNK